MELRQDSAFLLLVNCQSEEWREVARLGKRVNWGWLGAIKEAGCVLHTDSVAKNGKPRQRVYRWGGLCCDGSWESGAS